MTYSVVMVYEGDTEGVFYPLAIQEIRKELGLSTLPFKIHHVNIRGIGNFQTKLLAKMKNDIIPKCNSRIIVVLCYDTDVFEFYPHPFVNWQKLENELYKLGINQVIHMRARHSIEDFFLKDVEGLCSYLNIRVPRQINGKNGIEKIHNLFKKGNRVYTKGYRVQEFIGYLDIEKILNLSKQEMKVLYDLF